MSRRAPVAVGWLTLVALVVMLAGCGGGGGSSSDNVAPTNVQPVVVSTDPQRSYVNLLQTSVTLCVPGTSTCQTIPNVMVDTGSTGLRLLASAVTLPLPTVRAASTNNRFHECAAFADGTTWGGLSTADVKLGADTAASMSVQLIQDNSSSPAVPAACLNQGTPQNNLAALGTNGILGVGVFLEDCGSLCVSTATTMYYDCNSSGSCTPSRIPLAQQVANPVAALPRNNNGVVVQLPAIPANGVTSVSGNLIMGIGTQSNNTLSGTLIQVPASGSTAGSFTAVYKGNTLPRSFIDSGSSGLFFDDPAIATCSSTSPLGDLSGFFCPGSSTALSALSLNVTMIGSDGRSAAVAVSVANAQYLFTQPGAANLFVFNNIAGPASPSLTGSFDFGLPFFFGRSVFTAIEQRSTPNGSGPFFGFQPYP